MSYPRMMDSAQKHSRAVYPREMVIMIEDVQKVGEKEINEVMETVEMITETEVQCIEAGKSLLKMIGLSITPSRQEQGRVF